MFIFGLLLKTHVGQFPSSTSSTSLLVPITASQFRGADPVSRHLCGPSVSCSCHLGWHVAHMRHVAVLTRAEVPIFFLVSGHTVHAGLAHVPVCRPDPRVCLESHSLPSGLRFQPVPSVFAGLMPAGARCYSETRGA